MITCSCDHTRKSWPSSGQQMSNNNTKSPTLLRYEDHAWLACDEYGSDIGDTRDTKKMAHDTRKQIRRLRRAGGRGSFY